MIRVTTKQLSELSIKKFLQGQIHIYLAEFDKDISNFATSNEYYLTEDLLNSNYIKYKKNPHLGISEKND